MFVDVTYSVTLVHLSGRHTLVKIHISESRHGKVMILHLWEHLGSVNYFHPHKKDVFLQLHS